MHVRGEGRRPNYPVGGNAVGSGVEPGGEVVHTLVRATTQWHTIWVYKGLMRLLVLTRSVRQGWGHR